MWNENKGVECQERHSNFFSLPQFFSAFKLKDVKDQPLPQSSVFRKAVKAIYWIMQLVSLILSCWIVIYPMDSAIQRLNNSSQGVCNEVGPRWWQKMFYVVVDGDETRKTWTTVNYIQITLRPNCFFSMQCDWVSKKMLEFLKDLTKVVHFLLPFCSFSFQSFYFCSELLPFVGSFSDLVISVLIFLFPVCSPPCSVFFSFRGLQFVAQKRPFSQWPEFTIKIKSFSFSYLIYQSQWVWRYNSPA